MTNPQTRRASFSLADVEDRAQSAAELPPGDPLRELALLAEQQPEPQVIRPSANSLIKEVLGPQTPMKIEPVDTPPLARGATAAMAGAADQLLQTIKARRAKLQEEIDDIDKIIDKVSRYVTEGVNSVEDHINTFAASATEFKTILQEIGSRTDLGPRK